MTAVTTRPSTAPSTSSDHWVTTLFASRPARPSPAVVGVDTVSARSAFQSVVHGRATLVDVRTPGAVLTQGSVHPDLAPVVLDNSAGYSRGAAALASLARPGVPLIVLADDDAAAARIWTALRRLTTRRVLVLGGGFAAWKADGLPRVAPVSQAAA